MTDVQCVVRCGDGLGEGPLWSAEEQALYWVDILGKQIKRFAPGSGETRAWDMPDHPTALALRAGGGALVALRDGLYLYDFATAALAVFSRPDADRPRNRSNDGKCDARGRFWLGTMRDNVNPDGSNVPLPVNVSTGALYCVRPDRTYHKAADDIGIANTLAWSADDRTMYFADSLARTIYAYDFDAERGRVANRRTFAGPPGRGAPDGSAIDVEDHVWNARFGGGCVIRFAPDGSISRVVELPVTNPTCCAFGGPGLDVLYVTSGREGLSEQQIAENPREGDLFAFDASVAGLPVAKFAG